jgi:hypothetical protein
MARDQVEFLDSDGNGSGIIHLDCGRLTLCNNGFIDLDRPKARELAAILTHFADTGELPGEASDGGKV